MDKRNFIRTLSTSALSLPFFTSAIPSWAEELSSKQAVDLTSDEPFWTKVRQDYRLKPDYINLESGYYNIIPTPTLNHLLEHIKMVNYEGSYYMRTVQWDNKKRMSSKLAALVGCPADQVVITRNTTESLDLVIKGFPWKIGDEAVYAVQDYGAMRNMFDQVAEQHGVSIRTLSIPLFPKSDEELVDLYAKAITPKTRLLMVSHMINITGHILPVKKICKMAHSRGVQVMVDGAHCVGQFEFNLSELDCDYYGSSLHKWLSVPLGTGMLYVKKKHIDLLWPLFAEGKREPGDITRLNHTGTHPVYHDLTIENSIDYYNMLGAARKEARLRYLQNYWTSRVRNHPRIKVNTPGEPSRSCAIANVGIRGIKPADLADRLMKDYQILTVAIDESNVHGCRITPNVFSTTEELDVLVKALREMAS